MTSHLTGGGCECASEGEKMPNKWLISLICRLEKVQIERFKCQVEWKMLNNPEKSLLDKRSSSIQLCAPQKRTYRNQCMGSGTTLSDDRWGNRVASDPRHNSNTSYLTNTTTSSMGGRSAHVGATKRRTFWFTSAFVMLILTMDFSPKTLSLFSVLKSQMMDFRGKLRQT